MADRAPPFLAKVNPPELEGDHNRHTESPGEPRKGHPVGAIVNVEDSRHSQNEESQTEKADSEAGDSCLR